MALLNLENLYGTQEALLKVFDEALRQNEPIDVFFKLVTIYQNSEKYEVSYTLMEVDSILIPLLLACRAIVSNNDKKVQGYCFCLDTVWTLPDEAGSARCCQKSSGKELKGC